jgi:hypothetical protein
VRDRTLPVNVYPSSTCATLAGAKRRSAASKDVRRRMGLKRTYSGGFVGPGKGDRAASRL